MLGSYAGAGGCVPFLTDRNAALAPMQCLKYKTDQQVDLRKLERITLIFFPLMASGELPPEGEPGWD